MTGLAQGVTRRRAEGSGLHPQHTSRKAGTSHTDGVLRATADKQVLLKTGLAENPRNLRFRARLVSCQPRSCAGRRLGWLDDRSLPCLVLVRLTLASDLQEETLLDTEDSGPTSVLRRQSFARARKNSRRVDNFHRLVCVSTPELRPGQKNSRRVSSPMFTASPCASTPELRPVTLWSVACHMIASERVR